jgi:hypothetical protein
MRTAQVPAPPAPPSADLPRVIVDGVEIPALGQPRGELIAQRRELTDQLRALEGEKANLVAHLKVLPQNSSERPVLEQQLAVMDARIATTDAMLAANEAQLQVGSRPGVITVPPQFPQDRVLPKDIFALTGIFMFVVLLPLSVAIARRIWRRGAAATVPSEVAQRLERMEMAIDSSAVEIERIGEGQRYLTKLLSERRAAEVELPRVDARERIAAP